MTEDLLTAVDTLTKPEHRHLAQKDDFGKWIKVHSITDPPLLQRMHDAVHPSSNKTAGSASSASTRSPADLDAMFEYAKMTSQIRDWCRMQRVQPSRDAIVDLRRWYTSTLINPVHEPFYTRQLTQWATIIRNHLDPPETFTAKHPCPICGAKAWGDAINGGDGWPIEIRYRKDETDRMVDEMALCRPCKAVWIGHAAVMELAEEMDEKAG